jgi:hypothetical protein
MTVPSLIALEIRDPKSQGRKQAGIRRPNGRGEKGPPTIVLRISHFGLLSAFGFLVLGFSSLLVHNPNDHPTHWTFVVTDGLPSRVAVRSKDDPLMQAGPKRIDSNLRGALRLALIADRLADHQPPALEAAVLASRDHVAFNAS